MKPASEHFSAVDTAWLHMETATNLMVIAGFFVLDDAIDREELTSVLEQRLLTHARFRQRVVEPALFRTPRWDLDPEFAIEHHIDEVTLPGRGGERVFRELVDRLVATPLDFSRPLWHGTLIHNYRGGSAVFFRLHHAIADGIALLRVLLSVCDPDETSDPAPAPTGPAPGSFLHPAASAVAAAGRFAAASLKEGFDVLRNPGRAMEMAEAGTSYAKALARLTLLPPDTRTPLRGPLGVTKRAAWSTPLPLTEVKGIARAAGATVNDVLVADVSGALGRYLAKRGHDVAGLEVRAMVPVNIRPLDEAPELGNRFGLVLPALPIGIEDPAERLAAVKEEMDVIKRTPEAAVSFAILQTIGATVSEVQRLIVNFFGAKASAVLTNVPGPQHRLRIAGHEIREMMFWVPQSGRLGMGISILSYAGEVVVGIVTDEGLVPDPQAIIEELHAIHLESARAAGLRPKPIRALRPRCVAPTAAGRRCRNPAAPGATTCRVHGG